MTTTSTETRETIRSAPDHVVGIGASAGGLEALERFFDHLPLNTGMAFVLVQHLSPDFKSLMDELLGRHTDLPIHLVEDGMTVEPDHVYLIPPKKEMIIAGGRLHLSERDRQQELTLPIDVFFRSLAQDCGARAIAIVLSGGGTDGSRGVRAVHDAGGLVIVQEVARRLRADPATKDMFLIALTGYGQASDRAHALESGFDEHMVKPIQPGQLLGILGRRGHAA